MSLHIPLTIETKYFVDEEFINNFNKNISVIIGDEWYGGNLSYHLKSRPKWFNKLPDEIKETILFEKKILNKSKGVLKLLNVGELSLAVTIEVSYASKKAIEKVENNGGKVNLIKGL